MNNKNETFCKKIVSVLTDNNIYPIKTNVGNTSFEIIYNYAKEILIITGNDIDNKKTREVTMKHLDNFLILRKSDCTLKNITEALLSIFKKDNLPRCPKCGSRPVYYHKYEYYSIKVETDSSFLPICNTSSFLLPYTHEESEENEESENNIETLNYVIAECSCGNQWKLKILSSIYNIYFAYKEGNK